MLRSRCPFALAAVAVILLSSQSADAQIGGHGPHRQRGGPFPDLSTGAWYDKANLSMAEKHLPHAQERLRRDAERGNSAAVDRDVLRIDRLQHRIVVDEWLIRKNACQESGYYPYPPRLDPMSYCAIAQYRTPPRPMGRR